MTQGQEKKFKELVLEGIELMAKAKDTQLIDFLKSAEKKLHEAKDLLNSLKKES